jgi:hypothetical protein
MTITSIAGRRKFRVNPDDHCQVEMQPKHGAQWVEYAKVGSWLEASKLVFALASKREEETQELPVSE